MQQREKKAVAHPKSKEIQQPKQTKQFQETPKKKTTKNSQQIPNKRGVQLSLFDLFDELETTSETAKTKTVKTPEESFTPKPFTSEILPHYREGCLVEFKNQIGYLQPLNDVETIFNPLQLGISDKLQLQKYLPVRDTYFALYNQEAETLTEHSDLRKNLNQKYNDYVAKYGFINSKKAMQLLKMDTLGSEIMYLERSQGNGYRKADIFKQPVAFNPNEITRVDTPKEALSASLNKFSKVDLSYMQELTNFSATELKTALQEDIFYNPIEQEYQISDRFL